jgi:hypothetical protein
MPALKEPHFFVERGTETLSETRKLRYLPPKIIKQQENYLNQSQNSALSYRSDAGISFK